MATLVQPAPPPEQQVYHQPHHHHHHVQNRNQQHNHAAQYTAAIPVLFDQQSTIPGMQHPNIYKQVNIIPGLDAENAVVDTGMRSDNFVLCFEWICDSDIAQLIRGKTNILFY